MWVDQHERAHRGRGHPHSFFQPHQFRISQQPDTQSKDLTQTERYKSGIDSYLNVITAQATLLNNQRTAVNLQAQQMTATVQLIKALGGGWDASQLPTQKQLQHK